MIVALIQFFIGLFLLLFSANMLTVSLVTLSRFLMLNEFVTGFLLMAVATSIPELAVSFASALAGESAIALGNAIGSNIADMTLVLGVVSLVGKSLKVGKILSRDILEMAGIVGIVIVLSVIGMSLSRIDGVILVAVFIGYMFFLYKSGRKEHRKMKQDASPVDAVVHTALFIIFTVLLFISADMVVLNSKIIGASLGMPEILIGLVVLALGTTLPELFFETVSTANRHSDLSLGDLTGSVVVNSTLVLGVASVISPIPINFSMFASSYGFLLLASGLFFVFAESDKKITWKEGLVLLLLYLVFLIVEMQAKVL